MSSNSKGVKLELRSHDGRKAFEPGEEVSLLAQWELEQAVERIEARLVWYTQGKGTRDVGLAWSHRWEKPPLVGNDTVSLILPDGPYTFSGKLISLLWRWEFVCIPGERGFHDDLLIAPERREVLLREVEKT